MGGIGGKKKSVNPQHGAGQAKSASEKGGFSKLIASISGDPYLSAIVVIVIVVGGGGIGGLGSGLVPIADFPYYTVVAVSAIFAVVILAMRRELAWKPSKLTISQTLDTPLGNVGTDTVSLADQLGFTLAQRAATRDALAAVAAEVASKLGVNPSHVRANIFGIDSCRWMRMIADFKHNMTYKDEDSLAIPYGYGSSGRCFARNSGGATPRGNIATFRSDWASDRLADSEMAKLHPDLRWVLSWPILAPGQVMPGEVRKCVWVLNVDGLQDTPSVSDLEGAVGTLLNYSNLITLQLAVAAAGWRGYTR